MHMTLSEVINGYAESIGPLPSDILHQKCDCGSYLFNLISDDDEGGAYITCSKCDKESDIQSSRRYIENAVRNICTCDEEALHIAVGISYYENSNDPSWVYVGCKCPMCGLAGVYVDWKER